MAHFAELNSDNIVLRVVSVHDNEEENGSDFCHNLLGGQWIQTSYNGRIRKRFASPGFVYLPDADVFIAPQPYGSWVLDENFEWQPPTPMPVEGGWWWNEEKQIWDPATRGIEQV